MKSIYQKKSDEKYIIEAQTLYKAGLPLRKVAQVIGKSHEWVRQKLSTPTPLDKN